MPADTISPSFIFVFSLENLKFGIVHELWNAYMLGSWGLV